MEDRNTGFAAARIRCAENQVECSLDLNLAQVFESTNRIPERALDFLFCAAVVYAIDKHVDRQTCSEDGWTRELTVCIPVAEPGHWNAHAEHLSECVSFLTGDIWNITFSARWHTPAFPPGNFGRGLFSNQLARGEAVSLFSGGLDSYIGAIDWLESSPNQSLVLVGHYDGDIKGPHSDQERLYQSLVGAYPRRAKLVQMRIGSNPAGAEMSLRSRSLVFIALGIYAAECMSGNRSLTIPENGVIALNMPLTPARRGSCSTRTAHPYFITFLDGILQKVGFTHRLSNPYVLRTKGEMVRNCRNPALLARTASQTVSCAKGGHNVWWDNRTAAGCGRCVPCLFRRAALHCAGLDTEPYGFDLHSVSYALGSQRDGWNDLLALLECVRANPSVEAIGDTLLASGPLPVGQLDDYARVIRRTRDEVAAFIEAKGSATIKQLAGLSV